MDRVGPEALKYDQKYFGMYSNSGQCLYDPGFRTGTDDDPKTTASKFTDALEAHHYMSNPMQYMHQSFEEGANLKLRENGFFRDHGNIWDEQAATCGYTYSIQRGNYPESQDSAYYNTTDMDNYYNSEYGPKNNINEYYSPALPLDLSSEKNVKKDCSYDPFKHNDACKVANFPWYTRTDLNNYHSGQGVERILIKDCDTGSNLNLGLNTFNYKNLNTNPYTKNYSQSVPSQADPFGYPIHLSYSQYNSNFGLSPSGQFNLNVSMSMSMHIEPKFPTNDLLIPSDFLLNPDKMNNNESTNNSRYHNHIDHLRPVYSQTDNYYYTYPIYDENDCDINVSKGPNKNPIAPSSDPSFFKMTPSMLSGQHPMTFGKETSRMTPSRMGLYEMSIPLEVRHDANLGVKRESEENDVSSSSRDPKINHTIWNKNEKHLNSDDCTTPLSEQEEIERVYCDYCGKAYARPSTLRTHLRTHSGERPYVCQACGKTFSQAANLAAHVRTHSGERPYSCIVCHKTFSQSSSVTTHMRTHSGERPYACRCCGKRFADSSTLTKHARIHSGEKPYKCHLCSLRFSQSGNLNRHMRVHVVTSADEYKSY